MRKFKTGDMVQLKNPECGGTAMKFLGYEQNDMVRMESPDGHDDCVVFEDEIQLLSYAGKHPETGEDMYIVEPNPPEATDE